MAKAQVELPGHIPGSGVGTLLDGDKSRGICLGTGGKSGQRAHGLPALVQCAPWREVTFTWSGGSVESKTRNQRLPRFLESLRINF